MTTYSKGSPASVHTTDFAYNGNQIVLQFDATAVPGSASTLTVANLSHRYLSGQAVDEVFADEQVTSPTNAGQRRLDADRRPRHGWAIWPSTMPRPT